MAPRLSSLDVADRRLADAVALCDLALLPRIQPDLDDLFARQLSPRRSLTPGRPSSSISISDVVEGRSVDDVTRIATRRVVARVPTDLRELSVRVEERDPMSSKRFLATRKCAVPSFESTSLPRPALVRSTDIDSFQEPISHAGQMKILQDRHSFTSVTSDALQAPPTRDLSSVNIRERRPRSTSFHWTTRRDLEFLERCTKQSHSTVAESLGKFRIGAGRLDPV